MLRWSQEHMSHMQQVLQCILAASAGCLVVLRCHLTCTCCKVCWRALAGHALVCMIAVRRAALLPRRLTTLRACPTTFTCMPHKTLR